MAWMASMLILGAAVSLSRAANVDVLSRIDRSLIPYSGMSSARSPLRRYRYPIYTKRAYVEDQDENGDDNAPETDKRFLRGLNLRPLSLGYRAKKMHGLAPRYDISMTPYDLKAMAMLYRSGRRKRTPDLYDLKRIYRIYEAGRKRSASAAGASEGGTRERRDFSYDVWDAARLADAGKRSPVTSYYDLLDMARMAKAGKRAAIDGYHLWDLAQMEQAGKRSVDDLGLWDLARMEQAGKRSVDELGLWDLARMEQAGKRSIDDLGLWDLARMEQAGKRSVDDLGLWDLARMEQAGKRSVDNLHLLKLAGMADAGKRSAQHFIGPYSYKGLYSLYGKRTANGEDDDEGHSASVAGSAKQKRSFDDYFGWDRKKKSVVEDAMTDSYLATLKKQMADKTEKRGSSDGMGMVMKKATGGDED
ncbi:uncharacterized protein LOC119110296 [Pollicipes pollicipes]|uniref:uncharacterized protein LOC119110296 n=1 Tax=Pollicipes pollicipes TaxID=41117 RepID=UPI001884D436|nr:uncharacterized protein LOC119110296 [Pollicipes pollicipes]